MLQRARALPFLTGGTAAALHFHRVDAPQREQAGPGLSTPPAPTPGTATRRDSGTPAGPAPTMPTGVRMCCGTCLEGIWGNVTTDGDPARVCESLEIGCPAETRTG